MPGPIAETHPFQHRRSTMNDQEPVARHDRRVLERDAAHAAAAERRQVRQAGRERAARSDKLRKLAFGSIVVAVLAVGTYLAFGDFLRRPSDAAASGVIDVQSSMAGFTPSEIHVKAGATVTFKWWTQDAAMHLQGGVHTMISPDLGLSEQLPAESTRLVTWTVPSTPGTYDVWCESCCGGKDAPQMHGKIVVEPASAADDAGQAVG
jgi:cytochrome c oxidase subunit II